MNAIIRFIIVLAFFISTFSAVANEQPTWKVLPNGVQKLTAITSGVFLPELGGFSTEGGIMMECESDLDYPHRVVPKIRHLRAGGVAVFKFRLSRADHVQCVMVGVSGDREPIDFRLIRLVGKKAHADADGGGFSYGGYSPPVLRYGGGILTYTLPQPLSNKVAARGILRKKGMQICWVPTGGNGCSSRVSSGEGRLAFRLANGSLVYLDQDFVSHVLVKGEGVSLSAAGALVLSLSTGNVAPLNGGVNPPQGGGDKEKSVASLSLEMSISGVSPAYVLRIDQGDYLRAKDGTLLPRGSVSSIEFWSQRAGNEYVTRSVQFDTFTRYIVSVIGLLNTDNDRMSVMALAGSEYKELDLSVMKVVSLVPALGDSSKPLAQVSADGKLEYGFRDGLYIPHRLACVRTIDGGADCQLRNNTNALMSGFQATGVTHGVNAVYAVDGQGNRIAKASVAWVSPGYAISSLNAYPVFAFHLADVATPFSLLAVWVRPENGQSVEYKLVTSDNLSFLPDRLEGVELTADGMFKIQ